MASLSHPPRIVRISIDSVVDVRLMILVWNAYLREFCNLRYLSIVECSESINTEEFEIHKVLNGLEYEVDVFEGAIVTERRILWARFPRLLQIRSREERSEVVRYLDM